MEPPRVSLYLVRHGETDWNAEGRLQGQRDVPLNALGRVQAEEAARRLTGLTAALDELDFVASPLSRARDTMERLRAAAGLEPGAYRTDERLKELSFGLWEGLTWREVRARDAAGALARSRDKWNFPPPRGESYSMLAERLRPLLADIARDTVIVSHGGVMRAILALYGLVAPAEAPRIDVWQGRVLVLGRDGYNWV